jgi:hypothetical protein
MGEDDKLRLGYEQTHEHFRVLADIRFKLLAFVPTVTGLTVTLLTGSQSVPMTQAVRLLEIVRALGMLDAMDNVGKALGPIMAGLLLGWFSYLVTFTIIAGLLVVVAAALFILVRALD